MNKRNNSTWLSVQRWHCLSSQNVELGFQVQTHLVLLITTVFIQKWTGFKVGTRLVLLINTVFIQMCELGFQVETQMLLLITIVFMCITSFFFANLCITSLTEAVRAKRQRQGERRSDIWRGKVCRPQLELIFHVYICSNLTEIQMYIFRINKRETKIHNNVCISHVLFPIFS
jgi:hypothetical protein